MNIQDKIKTLTAEIEQMNKDYYLLDSPKESDSYYDGKFQELLEIERNNPELKSKNSPTSKVGFGIIEGFDEISHSIPMLSLDNVFSNEELKEYIVKSCLKIGKSPEEAILSIEPKLDGMAGNLRYEYGYLVSAGSRGDGDVGENITNNAKTIKDIPLFIENAPAVLEIRGEIFMSINSFNSYNNKAKNNSEKVFVNPRNAAAGSMRQLDSNITAKRNLSFIAYSFGEVSDGFLSDSHHKNLLKIHDFGFKINPETQCVKGVDACIEYYNSLHKKRSKLSMEIDGIVYKFDSKSDQDKLGFLARYPNWAIARKFPAEEAVTDVLDIKVQIGRTGAITPVAVLRTCFVGGVNVSSATLHNINEINRLGIMIGDKAVICRNGDVVPGILRIIPNPDKEKRLAFKMPESCPECGSDVKKNEGEAKSYCTGGLICDSQSKGAIIHYSSRERMNISGFGKGVANKLFDSGLLKTISDIYKLKESDIESLDGEGKASAKKLIDGINKSKETNFATFISSLGIREVGEGASKDIAKKYNSIEEIMTLSVNDFLNISGFGDVMSNNIYNFMNNDNNVKIINDILESGVNFKAKEKMKQTLINQTWVITGTLIDINRKQAKLELENRGAKVSGSVSNKTTCLLAGGAAGGKLADANRLGIRVIDESTFIKEIL